MQIRTTQLNSKRKTARSSGYRLPTSVEVRTDNEEVVTPHTTLLTMWPTNLEQSVDDVLLSIYADLRIRIQKLMSFGKNHTQENLESPIENLAPSKCLAFSKTCLSIALGVSVTANVVASAYLVTQNNTLTPRF